MSSATVSVDSLVAAKIDAQARFAFAVTSATAYVSEASRRPAVLAPGGVFDVEAAETSAIAEITSALAVSTSTVTEWMYLTGIARPAVREAFEAGRLAYPVFRTVCR
ncbi:MAG: hypothetical protein WA931_04335, partial [Rhodococcus sp. (in: high G+C Gram-positive bacteria)]